MTSVNFTLVKDAKGRSLTVYIDKDGEFTTHTIPETHANFDAILEELWEDEPDVDFIEQNVNIVLAVGARLNGLSERVSVTENQILFDGDPIDNALAKHIVSLVREGKDASYRPLVNFLEKVQTNPSADSVQALYDWITRYQLSITPDGDFIAYKGVKVGADGVSLSIHSGKAIVDGVVHTGNIPNPDGSVVEMPRSEVNANNGVGCSTGLHAGTHNYAKGFAQGRLLVVKINPRDVVSVPDDCNFQKLRVSRYTVLSTIEDEYTRPVYDDASYYEEDEDWDDEDWGDGEPDDDQDF